jgi:LisH domain-containing protein ARMC9
LFIIDAIRSIVCLSRIDDPFIEKLDYGKIKRDVVLGSMNCRSKALLIQALRWKLTKAKTDFKREKMLESYIGCDLLGCRTDIEQRAKVIDELSLSDTNDTSFLKEEWARFINTIASLRKGRQ